MAETNTVILPKKQRVIVGSLWKRKGISATTGQNYEFLSGSLNLEGQRVYISVSKSKLTAEQRAEKPNSAEYLIYLDDYKPKAKE